MLAAHPRSQRVLAMLEYMLGARAALASELAVVAGVESRQVYPLLRWWIKRRVVEVSKSGGFNVYRVSERVRRAVEQLLLTVLRSRGLAAARLAERIAESRLWRRLRPVERELVAMLAERLVSGGSKYVRVRAGSPREAIDILKSKIEERMRAKGADFNAISTALMSLETALDELREAGVIYIQWDTRNKMLVLRLDKGIEEELQRLGAA